MKFVVVVVVALAACAHDDCQESLASYCMTSECPQTWEAAQDTNSYSCPRTTSVALERCWTGNYLHLVHTDTAEVLYYDGSGKLADVVHVGYSTGAYICLAGDEAPPRPCGSQVIELRPTGPGC